MKKARARSIGKGALSGAVFILLGLLAGCAVSTVAPDRTGLWYQQSTGAYDTDSGRVFYGIGKAASLQNRTLQRVSADNQARLEMARLLEQYSAALAAKSASANTTMQGSPEAIEPALKALVHQAMQRAIVTDHWADPNQGRLHALCRLNLEDFKAVLNAHRGLRTDMRTAMQANLEIVHTQLSQKLHKNQ